jgi:hypothetical protein
MSFIHQKSPSHPKNAAPGMLFLHGGSYVVYAPCDAVYRSLASRLALQCGTSAARHWCGKIPWGLNGGFIGHVLLQTNT